MASMSPVSATTTVYFLRDSNSVIIASYDSGSVTAPVSVRQSGGPAFVEFNDLAKPAPMPLCAAEPPVAASSRIRRDPLPRRLSFCAPVPLDLTLRRSYNAVRGEAKLFQELLERGGRSKRFNADVVSFGASVFAPAKVGCLFYRDSRLHVWRQDRFPVASILIVKQLPRRHTDHPCPHPLLG